MKRLLIILFLIGSSVSAYCQHYTRDFGVRFTQGVSLGLRQFSKEGMAVEGILEYHDRGLRLIAMREFFVPAFTQYSSNLRVGYGFGVHGGVSYTNKYKILFREYRYDSKLSPIFGLDGFCALEYQMPDIPFLVAIDLRPSFEYSLNQFFSLKAFKAGISIKYRY